MLLNYLNQRIPCKTYLIKLDKGKQRIILLNSGIFAPLFLYSGHKPTNIATPEAEGADYQDLDHQYNLHEISGYNYCNILPRKELFFSFFVFLNSLIV